MHQWLWNTNASPGRINTGTAAVARSTLLGDHTIKCIYYIAGNTAPNKAPPNKPPEGDEMANPIIRLFAGLNASVYRMSGGRIMGKMGKSDICVVRMQGARSGKWRDVPLMYVPNGDGVILVASLGGAPKNPVWYYNLVAHPDIEVQVKQDTLKLRARLASREEKAAVWPRCVAAYPPYEAYQKRTTRDIPLFICEKMICEKR